MLRPCLIFTREELLCFLYSLIPRFRGYRGCLYGKDLLLVLVGGFPSLHPLVATASYSTLDSVPSTCLYVCLAHKNLAEALNMIFYRGLCLFCLKKSGIFLFCGRYCTCTAACSVTCALFDSLSLQSTAAEVSAISYWLVFLCRWRCTHCIWTIATRVHPPADRNHNIRSSSH